MSKRKNKKNSAFNMNQDDLLNDIDPEMREKTERLKKFSQAVWGESKNKKAKSIAAISRLVRKQPNGFKPS